MKRLLLIACILAIPAAAQPVSIPGGRTATNKPLCSATVTANCILHDVAGTTAVPGMLSVGPTVPGILTGTGINAGAVARQQIAAGTASLGNGGSTKSGNLATGNVTSTICDAIGGKICTYPGITRLPSGSLLMVGRAAAGDLTIDGILFSQVSADMGKSWSSQVTVFNPGAGLDVRDAELMTTTWGQVFLTYFTWDGTAYGTVPYLVAGYPKSDNSMSWGTPLRLALPSGWTTFQPTSKVIELYNGDLLLPMYGIKTGTVNLHDSSTVIVSHDRGVTWGSPIIAGLGTGTDSQYS